jgi:hypothetical protein
MTDHRQDQQFADLGLPPTAPVLEPDDPHAPGQRRLNEHVAGYIAAMRDPFDTTDTGPVPRVLNDQDQYALGQLVIQHRINKILADDEQGGFDVNGLAVLIAPDGVFGYVDIHDATLDYKRYRKERRNAGLCLLDFIPDDAWTRICSDLEAHGYTVYDHRG